MLNTVLMLLAFEDTAPGAAPDGMKTMLIYGGGLFAIFYFMLILPQKKEQKKREQMLNELKKHDTVVTHSGILGQIADISDDIVTLKVDDNQNVRIRFRRQAIAGRLDTTEGKDSEKKRGAENGKPDSTPDARPTGGATR